MCSFSLVLDAELTSIAAADKEQWEPVIQQLFANSNMRRNARRIREVWAFDWQNHGDSAILNRQLLKTRPEGVSEFICRANVCMNTDILQLHTNGVGPLLPSSDHRE